MPRMARLVVPGYPHHIVQRGSRGQTTFFCADDYRLYIDLLAESREKAGITVWAYCLMPNHTHLVAVPREEDSLARFFAQAHRRYTRHINFRNGWRGHLWQERFHSFVMDEHHLHAAVRYVELNPVRAGLCTRPQEWPWSSAMAHLARRGDGLADVVPILAHVRDWAAYLDAPEPKATLDRLRWHGMNGRPAGDDAFIARLERETGRSLETAPPGRPPNAARTRIQPDTPRRPLEIGNCPGNPESVTVPGKRNR